MPYLSSSPLQDRALQWYFLAAMGGLIVLTAVTVKVAKERPLYSNLAQGTTAVSRSLQVFAFVPRSLAAPFFCVVGLWHCGTRACFVRWLFVLSGCPQRLLRGRESEVEDTGCHSVFRDVWRGIRAMPRGMARVCIIQVGKRSTLCCRLLVWTLRGSATRLLSTCRTTTARHTCGFVYLLFFSST
jgi:hypothetical protein